MKIFYILILIIVCLPVSAQVHHEKYNGKYFKKSNDGYFVKYELNEKLSDGLWSFFENDTILRMEVNFFNGEKNGLQSNYYPNGNLRDQTNFVKGKIHGSVKRFHQDGFVLSELYYVNGEQQGIQTYFDPRGRKHHESYEFVKGQKHGVSREYLHDSTWKKSETTWVFGQRNGDYKEWYSSGQLRVMGKYYPNFDYGYLYSYNNRDGDWTYWNEDGEITKIEHWEKEKLVSITENISKNNIDHASLNIRLITKNCLGNYCLDDDIHLYTRSEGGYTKKGDSIYHRYYGDSVDHITLEPIFSDTNRVHSMWTYSPSFRTESNIGVGSTVRELIESGEIVEVIIGTGNHNPWLILKDYGIRMHLDNESNLLFRYRKDAPLLKNLRLDGYVTSIRMD